MRSRSAPTAASKEATAEPSLGKADQLYRAKGKVSQTDMRKGEALQTAGKATEKADVLKAAPAASSGLVTPGDRLADVVAFEESVVSFFVDAADLLGVPKSVAAIYGICFASPEPLSFSEIDDRLELSVGSISQGLRVLKEVGALKIAATETKSGQTAPSHGRDQPKLKPDLPRPATADPVSGSQNLNVSASSRDGASVPRNAARYEPDLELRNLLLHWIETRLQTQLKSGKSRLDSIMRTLPASTPAQRKVLKIRFSSLETWHDKSRALLPVVKTFLKLT